MPSSLAGARCPTVTSKRMDGRAGCSHCSGSWLGRAGKPNLELWAQRRTLSSETRAGESKQQDLGRQEATIVIGLLLLLHTQHLGLEGIEVMPSACLSSGCAVVAAAGWVFGSEKVGAEVEPERLRSEETGSWGICRICMEV